MLASDPAENTQASDPTEPMERIEPAEPIDKMDPLQPMDKIEPAEPMDRIEPGEPIDRIEPGEAAALSAEPLLIAMRPLCPPGPAGRRQGYRQVSRPLMLAAPGRGRGLGK